MISHEHRFIFIHVPKAGGTSIERLFGRDWDRAGNRRHPEHWPEPHRHHASILRHWRHLHYFKFTVVRNPWDRAVSEYFFNLRMAETGTATKGNRAIAVAAGSFAAFLKRADFWEQNMRPMVFWTTLFGRNAMNAIIRLEDIQAGFDSVCDRLGIPRQQVPHANRTSHRDYREYYDDEARALIAKQYARDIAMFGYRFDP